MKVGNQAVNNTERIKELETERAMLIRVRKSLVGPDKRSRYKCMGFNRMEEISRIDGKIRDVERELKRLGVRFE